MRGARHERSVEEAIAHGGAIVAGDRVLVACSGGPDSVALTAALHALAERLSLTLAIGFVDHGVRASALQDECVVLELAARLNVPLDVMTPAIAARDEQVLRDARYAALADAAVRRRCNVVATAHHAEDQSETVLLALLRGSGPTGLAGMHSRRALATNVDLARPLMAVSSERLRDYCHARCLPYAVDPTNADVTVRRNAVRAALEQLRPVFPGLDQAVARAAELLTAEQDATPRAQLRHSVRERLAADDTLRDIDFTHIEAAVRALEEGRSGTFHMKPGIAMSIEGGSIRGIKRL